MTADSRQVGATALRDLGQDAWLPLRYGQQYSHFKLVEANHYEQDDFSRNRDSSRLPFDWLLSATLGADSLLRARDPFRAGALHYPAPSTGKPRRPRPFGPKQ